MKQDKLARIGSDGTRNWEAMTAVTLKLAERGVPQSQIASALGVQPGVLAGWLAQAGTHNPPYSTFADSYHRAHSAYVCEMSDVVLEAARAGEYKAATWHLERGAAKWGQDKPTQETTPSDALDGLVAGLSCPNAEVWTVVIDALSRANVDTLERYSATVQRALHQARNAELDATGKGAPLAVLIPATPEDD